MLCIIQSPGREAEEVYLQCRSIKHRQRACAAHVLQIRCHMQGHSAQKGPSMGRGDIPRKRFLLGDIPMLPSLCRDEPEAALASPRLLSCLLALTPPADAAACTLKICVNVSLQTIQPSKVHEPARIHFILPKRGPPQSLRCLYTALAVSFETITNSRRR